MVYVAPSRDMVVRVGQHVTLEGRVYHHYLAHWHEFFEVSCPIESALVCCLLIVVMGSEIVCRRLPGHTSRSVCKGAAGEVQAAPTSAAIAASDPDSSTARTDASTTTLTAIATWIRFVYSLIVSTALAAAIISIAPAASSTAVAAKEASVWVT